MDMEVDFGDDVTKLVAKAGFDPVYGARPLRRALQKKVEDKLSEEILSSKILPGKKYVCRVENGEAVLIEENN